VRSGLFQIVARSAEVVLVWARNERLAQLRDLWPTLPPTPIENLVTGFLDSTIPQRLSVVSVKKTLKRDAVIKLQAIQTLIS